MTRSRTIVVLSLVLITGVQMSCTSTDPPPSPPTASPVTIPVHLDDGKIGVPETTRVTVRDVVEWTSDHSWWLKLNIRFKGTTLPSVQVTCPERGRCIIGPFSPSDAGGRYRYAVVYRYRFGGDKYELDPELIVDP